MRHPRQYHGTFSSFFFVLNAFLHRQTWEFLAHYRRINPWNDNGVSAQNTEKSEREMSEHERVVLYVKSHRLSHNFWHVLCYPKFTTTERRQAPFVSIFQGVKMEITSITKGDETTTTAINSAPKWCDTKGETHSLAWKWLFSLKFLLNLSRFAMKQTAMEQTAGKLK